MEVQLPQRGYTPHWLHAFIVLFKCPPLPSPPPPLPLPSLSLLLLCGQINYLSKKKNRLSRLLREQQEAVSQIIRELRAVRGSLDVIESIHEEMQSATEDYSTASFTTPYYSYIVKKLPLREPDSELGGLFTGHQATGNSHLDTTASGEDSPSDDGDTPSDDGDTPSNDGDSSSSGIETTDVMVDIDEQITNIEDSEKMAAEASAAVSQEETPVRSKWWLWTSGGGAKS